MNDTRITISGFDLHNVEETTESGAKFIHREPIEITEIGRVTCTSCGHRILPGKYRYGKLCMTIGCEDPARVESNG